LKVFVHLAAKSFSFTLGKLVNLRSSHLEQHPLCRTVWRNHDEGGEESNRLDVYRSATLQVLRRMLRTTISIDQLSISKRLILEKQPLIRKREFREDLKMWHVKNPVHKFAMRSLLLAGTTTFLVLLAVVTTAKAQVVISLNPPICSYGYYDYSPYGCAPIGFYGPGYFYNGIFLGVGPWANWGYGHGWGEHRFNGGGGGTYVAAHGNGGGRSDAANRGVKPSAALVSRRGGSGSAPVRRSHGTAAHSSPSHSTSHTTAAHGSASHGTTHATATHGGGSHGEGESHGNGGGSHGGGEHR
jgi:hypothetical protein